MPENATALGDKLAVSRREAANLLSIHITTFDSWVKRGHIRVSKIGDTVRVPVSELERLLRP